MHIKGRKIKNGVDYILHPLAVASDELLQTEAERVTAVLHDVIEDTDISFQDLEPYFPKSIINALELLTRVDGLSYKEYIKRIADSNNLIAIKVKYSDLNHNSRLSRYFNPLTEAEVERLRKYTEAKKMLSSCPCIAHIKPYAVD